MTNPKPFPCDYTTIIMASIFFAPRKGAIAVILSVAAWLFLVGRELVLQVPSPQLIDVVRNNGTVSDFLGLGLLLTVSSLHRAAFYSEQALIRHVIDPIWTSAASEEARTTSDVGPEEALRETQPDDENPTKIDGKHPEVTAQDGWSHRPPIFILGHHRSATTSIHRNLAAAMDAQARTSAADTNSNSTNINLTLPYFAKSASAKDVTLPSTLFSLLGHQVLLRPLDFLLQLFTAGGHEVSAWDSLEEEDLVLVNRYRGNFVLLLFSADVIDALWEGAPASFYQPSGLEDVSWVRDKMDRLCYREVAGARLRLRLRQWWEGVVAFSAASTAAVQGFFDPLPVSQSSSAELTSESSSESTSEAPVDVFEAISEESSFPTVSLPNAEVKIPECQWVGKPITSGTLFGRELLASAFPAGARRIITYRANETAMMDSYYKLLSSVGMQPRNKTVLAERYSGPVQTYLAQARDAARARIEKLARDVGAKKHIVSSSFWPWSTGSGSKGANNGADIEAGTVEYDADTDTIWVDFDSWVADPVGVLSSLMETLGFPVSQTASAISVGTGVLGDRVLGEGNANDTAVALSPMQQVFEELSASRQRHVAARTTDVADNADVLPTGSLQLFVLAAVGFYAVCLYLCVWAVARTLLVAIGAIVGVLPALLGFLTGIVVAPALLTFASIVQVRKSRDATPASGSVPAEQQEHAAAGTAKPKEALDRDVLHILDEMQTEVEQLQFLFRNRGTRVEAEAGGERLMAQLGMLRDTLGFEKAVGGCDSKLLPRTPTEPEAEQGVTPVTQGNVGGNFPGKDGVGVGDCGVQAGASGSAVEIGGGVADYHQLHHQLQGC